mmetsp:Transcript_20723/g.57909  ORF Transcript_20723/g.57909 Transcript_20723/m.57909 type:complete len:211 (-) Transcript_20723:638-1270(-)
MWFFPPHTPGARWRARVAKSRNWAICRKASCCKHAADDLTRPNVSTGTPRACASSECDCASTWRKVGIAASRMVPAPTGTASLSKWPACVLSSTARTARSRALTAPRILFKLRTASSLAKSPPLGSPAIAASSNWSRVRLPPRASEPNNNANDCSECPARKRTNWASSIHCNRGGRSLHASGANSKALRPLGPMCGPVLANSTGAQRWAK